MDRLFLALIVCIYFVLFVVCLQIYWISHKKWRAILFGVIALVMVVAPICYLAMH